MRYAVKVYDHDKFQWRKNMRKLRIISPICLILGHDFQFDHNLFTQTNGRKQSSVQDAIR